MLGLFQPTKTSGGNTKELRCLYLRFKNSPSFNWLCYKKCLNYADDIYTLALEVDCLQETCGVTDCVLRTPP